MHYRLRIRVSRYVWPETGIPIWIAGGAMGLYKGLTRCGLAWTNADCFAAQIPLTLHQVCYLCFRSITSLCRPRGRQKPGWLPRGQLINIVFLTIAELSSRFEYEFESAMSAMGRQQPAVIVRYCSSQTTCYAESNGGFCQQRICPVN